MKSLPTIHLGILLVGKELREKDCEGLLNNLSAYVDKWKTKMLSYGGRVKLANWVLCGKMGYWFQIIHLLGSIVKKAHSIVYKFIWNETKGVVWARMSLLKDEGGIWLKDPQILNQTTTIK